jgi:signal transduction histidine kinase
LQAPFGFIGLLGLTALAVALGAYPIVRRLTQRLEAVQRGVEQWGGGDLSVRLPEQGQDEVASLAQRFNVAAERVQTLVRSHKALLANASHELRSPLARIRMGLELMPTDPLSGNARVRDELARNIAELDQLIDEILLASRLDLADAPMGQMEEVDLVGLAAEECAQVDAQLTVVDGGPPFISWGSARLLRRVLRNLLENARRYGRDPQAQALAIEVEVRHAPARPGAQPMAEVVVRDHGPGVPEALRERIFEPFYRLPGASEREGGVGLGLSLVRTIAQRHGGQVRCEAAAGGGARFVLTLPLMA